VGAEAYSIKGTVDPPRNAAFEALMVAVKRRLPAGCSKDILIVSMETVKPF